MSEEKKPEAPTLSPELEALRKSNDALMSQLNNLKSEMNRKLDSLKPAPPKKQEEEEDLDTLMISEPAKAAKIIEERAEARIMNKLNQNQKVTNSVNQIVSDYPELADQNSDLYKKAVEIYSTLDEAERTSPVAYKYAVKEAAEALGVKPKSKRPQVDEDFDPPSYGQGQRRRRQRDASLSDATVEFAQRMGLNPKKDEALKKRLEQHSQRNWRKWKQMGGEE
jgi:hypothetical protein